MSKDIPEIDDLTRGINDSELILTEDSARAQIAETECNESDEVRNTNTSAVSLSDTGCWGDFMEYLQSDDSKRIKQKGLSANSTVTLRIHLMTAIYMADAALTW